MSVSVGEGGSESGGPWDGGEDGPADDPETSGEEAGQDAPPSSSDGSDESSETSSLDLATCPAVLPETWLFCEDFEATESLRDVFFEVQDGDGTFVLTDKLGASGTHSMKASYREGVAGAGWLSISLGENPVVASDDGRPQYASDERFDELYVRFYLRTESGWPDVGPRKLLRVMSLANDGYGQAMVASLQTDGDATTLVGNGGTCVNAERAPCASLNEDTAIENVGWLPGQTPLFSQALSGEWHCIEAHVRLNTPGARDGAFDFSIDGAIENGLTELDWRGTWDAYGLNLVTLENFWTDGAPAPLSRWIDDIVIATEPIGCDGPLPFG